MRIGTIQLGKIAQTFSVGVDFDQICQQDVLFGSGSAGFVTAEGRRASRALRGRASTATFAAARQQDLRRATQAELIAARQNPRLSDRARNAIFTEIRRRRGGGRRGQSFNQR